MPEYTTRAKYKDGEAHLSACPAKENRIAALCNELFNVDISVNTVKNILGTSRDGARPGTYHYVHCIFTVMQIETHSTYSRRAHVLKYQAKGQGRGVSEDSTLDQALVYVEFYKHRKVVEAADKLAFSEIGRSFLDQITQGAPVPEELAQRAFAICKTHMPDIEEDRHLMR